VNSLAAEKRILELIVRGEPLANVLSAICLLYEEHAPDSWCSVYLVSGKRLFLVAGPSIPATLKQALTSGVPIGPRSGSCGSAVHFGARVISGDVTTDEAWVDYRPLAAAHGIRASWSTPIRAAGGEVLGTYAIYYREPRTPRDVEIELIDALAHVAGIALERHRVTDALRESEERYRALADGLSEVIVQTGAGGRLTFVSSSFAAATGVMPADAIGRELADFVHPDDRARLIEVERAILAGERSSAHLELRVPIEGGQRWIDWTVRARRAEDGAVIGLGGILADVTERKTLEAQLLVADRMASMGTLVAGVAHEINNPLASVMLNLEYLTRELSGALLDPSSLQVERLLDPLRAAAEGVERVRDLVRNLKVFSRADDRRRLVDVRQVVESTLRMAQNEVRHRARIARDFREVPAVKANEAELGQVFLNLIINAAQAIPEGRLDDHEIRVVTRTGRGGSAVVEVRDTGAGIPPEHLDRIFDPFFTTKPVGVGTGLGLSICHRLVSAMGGEISVESEIGIGSVFRVTLPASEHVDEPRRRPSQPMPAVKRAHILVVDDEPFIGDAVRRLVVPLHEVSVVASSEEALARIRAGGHYDVILCDLMMPRMNGVQLHDEVARFSPELADRMLFITGGAFTPAARDFLEGRQNRILEKPFDARSLMRAVQERLLSRVTS
jgi:PAS domain S-box-containing protein